MKLKLISVALVFIFIMLGCSRNNFTDDEKDNVFFGHVSISPNDKDIVFSFRKNKIVAIYKYDVNNNNIIRLTWPENESHFRPVYSPDGNKVLFLSYLNNTKTPKSSIYVMDSDGSNVRQITKEDTHITEAIFSPDARKIYFLQSNYYGHYSPIARSRPHEFDIYEIGIDGSNFKHLTNFSAYEIESLSISPDGAKLLFRLEKHEEKNKFFVLNLNNLREIIPLMPINDISPVNLYYYPQFSPDGSTITFASAVGGRHKYEYELFIMDIKSKQAKQLTNLRGRIGKSYFLNERNSILFMQEWGYPNYRLMRIDTDGSNLAQMNLPFEKIE